MKTIVAPVDKKQNRLLDTIVSMVALLGGITALLAYLDNRKNRQLQERVLALDQEIKEMQLSKLKNGNS